MSLSHGTESTADIAKLALILSMLVWKAEGCSRQKTMPGTGEMSGQRAEGG